MYTHHSKSQSGACSRRYARRRKGAVLSIELVMVVPILLSLLLAAVEFGILLMATQGVGAAANIGSRAAAVPSSNLASVEAAVNTALDGWAWRGKHKVLIFVNGQKATPGDDRLASAVTGDVVSVTVNVPMNQAAPDLLRYFGISIAGKELTTTYVTRKE
jgi:Flp pilus assembly protein TadG